MGGGMSTESKRRQAQTSNISAPRDPIMHVPRPRLDHDGKAIRIEDHELDRQTLETALKCMAEFIDRQGQNITLIIVGGAVNTMLLQSPLSTHDVDFLGTNLNNDQRVLLDEAAGYAEMQSQIPLGGEWFNNQVILWLPPNVHHRVTKEALEQDDVVFEKRGLKVIAAPWNYALCGKMNRLVRRNEVRRYDVTDAASYLHHYILKHGGPVSPAQIKQWCQEYQKDTSNDAIRAVAKEYRRRYGSNGIAGWGLHEDLLGLEPVTIGFLGSPLDLPQSPHQKLLSSKILTLLITSLVSIKDLTISDQIVKSSLRFLMT